MQNPEKSEGIKGRFFVQAPQNELKAHYKKLSRKTKNLLQYFVQASQDELEAHDNQMKKQNEQISTVVSIEEIVDDSTTLEEALKTIDC